jgi:hypothetical protein
MPLRERVPDCWSAPGRRLLAIERDRVEADVVAPERFLEALAQPFGLGHQRRRAFLQAQACAQIDAASLAAYA